MSDFRREVRYYVIKIKDLTETQDIWLCNLISGLNIPCRDSVVVEKDWRNYEHTWKTVEQVASGTFADPYVEIEGLNERIEKQQSDNEALRQQLAESEARVAELEEGLHGIANCAYGYNHPKAQTADEAASWMNVEAMRLLGNPQPKAYVLRKQAEAVEEIVDADPDGRSEDGAALISVNEIWDYAQSLRQQADEAERAGGEHG